MHTYDISTPRGKTKIAAAIICLLLGLPASAAKAQTVCPDNTTLNNCGIPSASWPTETFIVKQTNAAANWYGIYAKWNYYKVDGLNITTNGSGSDAIRTDAAGSFIFINNLTVTATGSSADGMNIASNDAASLTSPWNIGVIVRDSANITTTSGMGVRANAMLGEGGSSIAILPSGSIIRVIGTGTATQGSSTFSADAYGYAVYAGNRNWDMNNIGTSGALTGTNNNALGNAYAFIGSHSTISDSMTNGHAVYANKGGFIQLGDAADVSATGKGAYALYAATEQQGSYTTNVRPGYIFLEGGATLRVTNGVAGSNGAGAIVMEANGAGSIIANRAIDYANLLTTGDDYSGYTLTGSYNSMINVLPDKTAWTATSGVFNVVGIMDARNGGAIDLNMADTSSFTGSTNQHLEMATPSTINLNIDGAASAWNINANSTLNALNLSAGATLEPFRADNVTPAPTAFVLTATSDSGVTSTGGIINLQNPGDWSGGDGADGANVAGDALTIKGNYSGSNGAQLKLDTYLDTDGSPSDRLVIDGGKAGGATSLLVNNVGGAGALTTGNGILVVDTTNGGTTDTGAFALDTRVAAGPYEYTLFRSGMNGAGADNWYLRSNLSTDCGINPNAKSCDVISPPPDSSEPPDSPESPETPPELTPPPDPSPVIPHYRIETSVYTALPSLALLYGHNLLDTLHERVGEEEDIRGRNDLHEKTPEAGGWGRAFATRGQQDGDAQGIYGSSGPQYDYNFYGLQVGQDLFRKEHSGGSRDHAGLYFAYGHANSDVTHFDGSRGRNQFGAYSLGGYWTHFAQSGWYTDAVLQGTYYDTTSSTPGMPDMTTHGSGFAASLEGGKPFRFGQGYFIEPQAQLTYQVINFAGVNIDNGNTQVSFNNADSLVGRIGARFGYDWNPKSERQVTVWLRPNLWHEFRGNPTTEFSSADGPVPFKADLGGAWGEINAGISGQINRNVTLFANISYNERFDGGGYAYDGKIGLRINW